MEIDVRLVCIIVYIFHILLSNYLSVTLNDSMIISDTISPGGEGMVNISEK